MAFVTCRIDVDRRSNYQASITCEVVVFYGVSIRGDRLNAISSSGGQLLGYSWCEPLEQHCLPAGMRSPHFLWDFDSDCGLKSDTNS